MKIQSNRYRFLSVILSLAMVLGILTLTPVTASAADSSYTFTFSDNGVTASADAASGEYEISETTLTICASGTYTITGSCSEGLIEVKKSVTGVTLILQDLDLACSSSAPLVIKKTASATLDIEGTVVLTDNEDPANETSEDADIADAFEGAAIKVKSGSTLTISGSGTLTADGSACKNAIKGGSEANIIIEDGVTINAGAANNGIASDGSLTINGGTISVTSGNDGIKSVPDDDDTASAGELTINGGTFTINSTGDAIQAANLLTINGGTFDITTYGGYEYISAAEAADVSAKGLKASSGSSDDTTSTETADSEATNTLIVNGGTFRLNTADDAVHSDAYIYINGGDFEIYTGDDAMHADTLLQIGSETIDDEAIEIDVEYSYEGLEAGTVDIYSGHIDVYATDDGINAAGGSSDGTDTGTPWGGGFDPFNPGGGSSSSGDYSLNIYGGYVTVDAQGDGLDSNGAVNLTGGYIIVWGMQAGGDNEPIDADGSIYINGATIFAAGGIGMGAIRPASGSQYYVSSQNQISSGKTINVKDNDTTVYNIQAIKNVNYVFFSSPDVTSNGWSITADNSSVIDSCVLGHDWEETNCTATCTAAGFTTYTCSVCGETKKVETAAKGHTYGSSYTVIKEATCTEDGEVSYTCTVCGESITETIAATGHSYTNGYCTSCGEEDPDADWYEVSFSIENGSVNVYTTQTTTDDTYLDTGSTYYARNSDTGKKDISGSGQVNFVVVPDSGYTVSSIDIEGTYKNLKTVDADTNTYRVTKVGSDLVITVTLTGGDTDPCADGHSYDEGVITTEATCTEEGVMTYTCQNCGATYTEAIPATGHSYGADGECTTCGAFIFTDVDTSASYYKAVKWAYQYGIVTGTSDTTFSPAANCTRAQFAIMLYRLAGKPDVSGLTCPFTDISALSSGAQNAIIWAYNAGIVTGTSDTTYSPDSSIRRAQIAVMLYRMAGKPDVSGMSCPFTDISSYNAGVQNAVIWAYNAGVTTGSSSNRSLFKPKSTCKRYQLTLMLYRYNKLYDLV